MDRDPGSLEPLLELAAEHERAGLSDAPWPPHYLKQKDEPARVQPSKRRKTAAKEPTAEPATPRRRQSKLPVIEIGRGRQEAEVMAGLERWKARHPEAAVHLEPADVLVDRMRGRSSLWYRVRANLQHVPVELRPKQESLDPDDDPYAEWRAKWQREEHD
jgi:hypothetical protein